MKPASGRRTPGGPISVSREQLERLATPLTVLHANIQLVQRRIRTGNVPEPAALLRTLDKLERASETLAAELRELYDAASPTTPLHETIENRRPSAMPDRGERDA